MRKKILVLMGSEFTHFCLTYFLQKKLDAEYYGIVDSPDSQKKFFSSQKIVKFNKIWFFHEHVNRNHIPDKEFLVKLEKKYNLNLWLLALNERIFYKFFRFHKFTRNEILSILEQSLVFFEKVLDETKPDFLLIKLPHLFHQELILRLCRERGIKVLMLNTSLIGSGSIIMRDPKKYDELEDFEKTEYNMMTFNECNEIIKDTKKNLTNVFIYENRKISFLFKALFKFIFTNNKKINTNYDYYGRTKIKVIIFQVKDYFNSIIRRRYIDKNLEMNPALNKSFIYMPLNVEMERSTLIDAPFFTNHVETIRAIAKSIPIDFWLFVKEHPAQAMRSWRRISDYKQIMDIPNVILIHPNYDVEKLYQHCKLVITISGTAGFEAAIHSKPSIVLSDQRYNLLPSVERCYSIEQLPTLIRESLERVVDFSHVSKYMYFTKNIINNFNWGKFNREFNNLFYPDLNFDVEISESKLIGFLNENEATLSSLAEHHLMKINFEKK